MESIIIVLTMLLAVVASAIIARTSPFSIPLPLVQISFGMLIAAFSSNPLEIEPHVFFLLFLPPLLFLDGWRIPKDQLASDKMTVLSLAIGLVVFTVLGAGLFINWLIPTIPLPVAFALAAIISPTDPVAVSAITSRVPIPARLMHILEGEALLNDASGLVCMRLAVAAMLTGVFSFYTAIGTFLWLSIGGVVVGVATAWLITKLKNKISHRYGEEAGSEILVSLLVPFAAYLVAEKLQCSGILAAVASGMTMGFLDYQGTSLATTRIQRRAVWDTVQFALNGTIFVLLGEQLPSIISGAQEVVLSSGHINPWWLYVYIILIYSGLFLLRFIWVCVSLKIVSFRAINRGVVPPKMSINLLLGTTLAGVRGAVTLAGVMTLPLTMLDGTEFPGRDLAIFLATGIILVSILSASIGMPFVLRKLQLPARAPHKKEEMLARVETAKAAIIAVEEEMKRLAETKKHSLEYADIATELIEIYRNRIYGKRKGSDEAEMIQNLEKMENHMRRVALNAEREKVFELRRISHLSEETMRKIMLDIDLSDARIANTSDAA